MTTLSPQYCHQSLVCHLSLFLGKMSFDVSDSSKVSFLTFILKALGMGLSGTIFSILEVLGDIGVSVIVSTNVSLPPTPSSLPNPLNFP